MHDKTNRLQFQKQGWALFIQRGMCIQKQRGEINMLPIPLGSPEDMENLQKAFELLSRFAPFLSALAEHMPPLTVKELKVKETIEGKEVTNEYIGLLLPKKPKEEKK